MAMQADERATDDSTTSVHYHARTYDLAILEAVTSRYNQRIWCEKFSLPRRSRWNEYNQVGRKGGLWKDQYGVTWMIGEGIPLTQSQVAYASPGIQVATRPDSSMRLCLPTSCALVLSPSDPITLFLIPRIQRSPCARQVLAEPHVRYLQSQLIAILPNPDVCINSVMSDIHAYIFDEPSTTAQCEI